MKTLFLAAALLGATPAVADLAMYPPKQYDYRFAGTVRLIQGTPTATRMACGGFIPVYGCAYRPAPKLCVIYMVSVGQRVLNGRVISQAFYDVIVRHEMAHCNGWPARHPNVILRPLAYPVIAQR